MTHRIGYGGLGRPDVIYGTITLDSKAYLALEDTMTVLSRLSSGLVLVCTRTFCKSGWKWIKTVSALPESDRQVLNDAGCTFS